MGRVAVIVGSSPSAGAEAETAGGLPSGPPRSDRAAVALAAKRLGGRFEAYCLRDDGEALRYALAAGARSATRVADPRAIDFDLALVGSGGAGEWGDALAALLAESKRCALVLEVLDVEPVRDGWAVTRDLGRGAREIIDVRGGAVLGVAEGAAARLYVSRHRRRAAGTALPAAGTAPGDGREAGAREDPLAGASGPWEVARPRARTADLERRTRGAASERMQELFGLSPQGEGARESPKIVADATTCARALVRYLSHHGFVARGAAEAPEVAPDASAAGALGARGGRGPLPMSGSDLRRPRPLEGEGSAGSYRGPRPGGKPD